MSDYRQDPPNCIQIEPTEGCNLRCSYCGIQGIREKGPMGELSGPYKYMLLPTASAFARQLWTARTQHGWNPRIEIAMHGEPTLNPELVSIVRVIKQLNPNTYILMETNGIPLIEGFDHKVLSLFRAGIDTLAIDDYRPHRVRDSFKKFSSDRVRKFDYPRDTQGNPHERHLKTKRLVLVEDIASADDGNHSHLSNHAGCGSPKSDLMQGKRCALPFREMAMRWNGAFAVCCNDWRGIFKLGNIHSDSLVDMWHSEVMYAIRKKLYAGRREDGPCDGCTHRSYRVGLLPDKKGLRSLPAADATDQALIDAAIAGPTLTPVVLRGYEKP